MEVLRDNWKFGTLLTAAAATGAVAGAMFRNFTSKANENQQFVPQKWIRVATVKEILIYPVKSLQGISVSEAACTEIGLKASNFLRDRIFMVVNDRSKFLTQRQLPRMALIRVAVTETHVTLSSPGHGQITFNPPLDSPENRHSCRIFQETVAEALDCGDKVGAWLSNFLEQDGLRLLYHSKECTQRELVPLQKKFPTFVPRDKGAFSDQTAYMIMTEESVEMLNTKLDTPVTHKNFRPNILLTGVLDPFSEDYWSYLRIGDLGPVFKTSKPCTRCILTTVNPATGEFNERKEPLNTLTNMNSMSIPNRIVRSYGNETVDKLVGNQAVIGLQVGLFHGNGHFINVGDPVYAAVL